MEQYLVELRAEKEFMEELPEKMGYSERHNYHIAKVEYTSEDGVLESTRQAYEKKSIDTQDLKDANQAVRQAQEKEIEKAQENTGRSLNNE